MEIAELNMHAKHAIESAAKIHQEMLPCIHGLKQRVHKTPDHDLRQPVF